MARPREFDEQAAVRGAMGAFRHRGYAATSLDDLTAASGIGRSSLYGAFGDKHDLFLRALDEYSAGALAGMHEALDGPDATALERLRAYARAMARASAVAGTPADGCLLALATAERADSDEAVADRALKAFRAFEELLRETIAQAQDAGDLDSGANARRLARTLLATLRGLESLGRAGMSERELVASADEAVGQLPRP